MQLSALSQVNNFRSHLVSWSFFLLATTTWNIFQANLTSLCRSIYFDGSYDATEQRWKYGVLNAACVTIPTTITASIAHIVWYSFFSRGFLVAVIFDGTRNSILIASCAFGFVLGRGTCVDESGTQALFRILSATNCLFFHEFLDNGIKVLLFSEFLYFNLCLIAFDLLAQGPPSKTDENSRYWPMDLKETNKYSHYWPMDFKED